MEMGHEVRREASSRLQREVRGRDEASASGDDVKVGKREGERGEGEKGEREREGDKEEKGKGKRERERGERGRERERGEGETEGDSEIEMDAALELVDQMEIEISDGEGDTAPTEGGGGEGEKEGVASKVTPTPEVVRSGRGETGQRSRTRRRHSSGMLVVSFPAISMEKQLSDQQALDLMNLLHVCCGLKVSSHTSHTELSLYLPFSLSFSLSLPLPPFSPAAEPDVSHY